MGEGCGAGVARPAGARRGAAAGAGLVVVDRGAAAEADAVVEADTAAEAGAAAEADAAAEAVAEVEAAAEDASAAGEGSAGAGAAAVAVSMPTGRTAGSSAASAPAPRRGDCVADEGSGAAEVVSLVSDASPPASAAVPWRSRATPTAMSPVTSAAESTAIPASAAGEGDGRRPSEETPRWVAEANVAAARALIGALYGPGTICCCGASAGKAAGAPGENGAAGFGPPPLSAG